MSGLHRFGFDTLQSETPVIPILVGDPARTLEFTARLRDRGVLVCPAIPPMVQGHLSRVRGHVTAAHDDAMIDAAISRIGEVGQALGLTRGSRRPAPAHSAALNRDISGGDRRRRLRRIDRWLDPAKRLRSPAQPSIERVKEVLRRLIEQNAGIPGTLIRDDSSIEGDLAMDSMSFVSLQVAVEETFGIRCDAEDLESRKRFDAMAALIQERVEAPPRRKKAVAVAARTRGGTAARRSSKRAHKS